MTNSVTGMPRVFLRLDGLVLFIASIYLFKTVGVSWWVFIGLLFVPDIFMLGYLVSKPLGAYLYNIGHSYLAPAVLLWFGYQGTNPQAMAVAFVWFAHVGMDRLFGYGLKYQTNFKDTHLGAL